MKRFFVSSVAALLIVVSSLSGPQVAREASAQALPGPAIYVGGTIGYQMAVSLVDQSTGKFTKSINIPTSIANTVGPITSSPDGKRLYVVGSGYNGVGVIIVISTASNTIIDSWQLDICLNKPSVSPDSTKLFVVSSCHDKLFIIDIATHQTQTVAVGRAPAFPTVNPDGKTVYVPVTNSCYICTVGTVWAIDTKTGAVKAQIPVGYKPFQVAIDPTGTRGYVTNQAAPGVFPYYGKTLSVLDLVNNVPLPSITVGQNPTPVAVSPNGQKVYVGNYADATVSIINTQTNSIDTKTVGNHPNSIGILPDSSKAYVNTDVGIAVFDSSNNLSILPPVFNTSTGAGLALATPPPVIASLATKPTAVVLLQGIGTSLNSTEISTAQQNCAQLDVFNNIVNALIDSGFKCSDFLLYSYLGGSDSNNTAHTWTPSPYSCDATVNIPITLDITTLQNMLQQYRQDHPGVRFVLIGHSLGGVIAFESSTTSEFPSGTIPVVATLDSPLNHVSLRTRTEIKEVIPFSNLLSMRCDVRALFSSDPAEELGNVTDSNRQSVRDQQSQIITAGHAKGMTFLTVGNFSDCLWNLNLCYMPRQPLNGSPLPETLWDDDHMTMFVDNADLRSLYTLGTFGCDLSGVQVDLGKLACLNSPHGAILNNGTAIKEIIGSIAKSLT